MAGYGSVHGAPKIATRFGSSIGKVKNNIKRSLGIKVNKKMSFGFGK